MGKPTPFDVLAASNPALWVPYFVGGQRETTNAAWYNYQADNKEAMTLGLDRKKTAESRAHAQASFELWQAWNPNMAQPAQDTNSLSYPTTVGSYGAPIPTNLPSSQVLSQLYNTAIAPVETVSTWTKVVNWLKRWGPIIAIAIVGVIALIIFLPFLRKMARRQKDE